MCVVVRYRQDTHVCEVGVLGLWFRTLPLNTLLIALSHRYDDFEHQNVCWGLIRMA